MRIVPTLLVAAAFAALAAPVAFTNQASPPGGTSFDVTVGDKEKVKIKGTGGCTFEVVAVSSDEDVVVASVKKDGASKSHKVDIEAVGAGTATVTVMTMNGTSPSCEGFTFEYDVTVSPDLKELQKAVKSKTKEQVKGIKDALDDVLDPICDEIDGVVDLVKDGEVTPGEAIGALEDFGAQVGPALSSTVSLTIDTAFTQIWTCPEAQGYLELSGDLQSFLPGGCGEYDEFVEQVEKEVEKAEKKLDKKVKKAIKDIDKVADAQADFALFVFDLLVGVPTPQTPVALPAETPQTPAAPLPKPLTKNWTSSGRLGSSATSRLTIGGTGDGDSGQVSITIEGPDDFDQTEMVDVDENCEWTVDFTSLPPGHYTVTLSQGGQSMNFTTVVV